MALTRDKSFLGDEPILYIVATPIGNREEVSQRFLNLLKEMDFIAAEDTRNSSTLLQSFGIKKPFIACHEHNEEEASDKIIALLLEGKKLAYMSDAGYPLVSDPGSRLVKRVINAGIKVSVINGPSAFLPALVGSNLPTDHFYFYGFLPPKEKEREKELRFLKPIRATLIFYEAPHRIKDMLISCLHILGDRKVCLARELSKLHEEYIRGSLEELVNLCSEEKLKGEIVLIVEGCKDKEQIALDEADILSILYEELKVQAPGPAAKTVADKLGLRKAEVYDLYLRHKNERA